MANSNDSGNSNVVSVVGVVAILILVGLAVYFVVARTDDDAEFEIDLDSSRDHVPVMVGQRALDAPSWAGGEALTFLG